MEGRTKRAVVGCLLIAFAEGVISNCEFSKPCGIRAARKLRVVRRQERWADKVCARLAPFHGIEVQEGSQHFFH